MIAITSWSDGNGDPNPINYDYATVVYREDFPAIVGSIERVSPGFHLRFNGMAGLTYRLQRASSVNGPWVNIATITAPASGLVELQETNPPSSQAFYRTVQP